MSVIARLSTPQLTVDPGGEAILQVLVRNNGRVVDEYTVELLGEAAPWVEIDPPAISLFPGADGTVTVTVHPPRASTTAARAVPFGVRVRSREDPDGSVTEEGVIEVAAFTDTLAELLPGTSRGSRRGLHDIAVDNRGNVPLRADIAVQDQANELRFQVRPPVVVAGPGNAGMARLVVRPRRRYWRGPAKTRSFQVQVRPEGEAPLNLTGTMLQEPLLPAWAVPAAIGLAGLLLAGVLLWFALLKPTIQTAARDAASDATTGAVEGPMAQMGALDSQQQKDIAGLQQAVNKISPDAIAAVAAAPAANPLGSPTDGRLQSGHLALTVEDKATVSVTDIIFENPNGDVGPIRLRRVAANGESTVLLDPRLDNFRDLDYHFVSPVTLTAGQRLELDISGCRATQSAPAGSQCGANIYYTGYQATTP